MFSLVNSEAEDRQTETLNDRYNAVRLVIHIYSQLYIYSKSSVQILYTIFMLYYNFIVYNAAQVANRTTANLTYVSHVMQYGDTVLSVNVLFQYMGAASVTIVTFP